jgi:hypothetical protein
MNILGIFFVASLLISIGYYFALLHKGVIKDSNKNFMPDPVEDAAKRVKKRYDKVAEEMKDVANAITGDNPQEYESKEEEQSK